MIARQYKNLEDDPLNLPERAPGDELQPKLSRWGHREILVPKYKGFLEEREAEYARECDDNDPNGATCPEPQPGPEPAPEAPLPKSQKNAWPQLPPVPWWIPVIIKYAKPVPVPA
jgi:hypothetical protein